MKVHTSDFKIQSRTNGKRINSEINYGENSITKYNINSLKFAFNTELFRTIMKQVTFDTNIQVSAKTWVNPKFGYKVGDAYEMLDYGSYYINEKPIYNVDNRAYTHIAYDSMIEAMIPYDESPLDITYPITYGNLLLAIANKLDWTFTQTGFPNENTEIPSDIYKDLGLTYRDILDDLCPASMGNLIVTADKEMQIIYPTETSDTIDEHYLDQDNINIGKKIGPINALVLSRAEDGDTINRVDEDSIVENGIQEIKIKDNLLLSSEFREDFIDEMFDKIKGFEYYEFDIKTVGLAYYDLLDKFTISLNGNSYPTVVLNCDLTIEGGVQEQIYAPTLEESVTDYSTSAQTDKAQKMATIIAYKNQAKIEMVTQQVEDNARQVTSVTQTVDGIVTKISKIDDLEERTATVETNVEGINVKLNNIGGGNLVINSARHFTNGWDNLFPGYTDTEIKNNSVSKNCFFVGDGTMQQTVQVQNGIYTVSLKYKKLLELANVSIRINDNEYILDSMNWAVENYLIEVKSNTITIEVTGDTENCCYLTDLMCNVGSIANVWSPAAGESINGGVKISDKIEIESSVSNIKQVMDNDGNRIYNISTGEVVAEYTDKGLQTNEIISNKAQIGGLLIQKLSSIDQTWISRV